jgi:hypothetical protein
MSMIEMEDEEEEERQWILESETGRNEVNI